MTTTCWICGGFADTGEHRIKASDLRQVFGRVSQKKPLYTIDRNGNPVSTGSVKSDRHKFTSPICKKCNSSRTQPHDIAWQKLSEYIYRKRTKCEWVSKVNVNEVFGTNGADQLLYVHLYFNKIMGCHIHETGAAITTKNLSNAIIKNIENTEIRLRLWETDKLEQPYAQLSEFKGVVHKGNVARAMFYYSADRLHVEVIYTVDGSTFKETDEERGWLPSEISTQLHLSRM